MSPQQQPQKTNPADAKRSHQWLAASFAGATQLITAPEDEIPMLLQITALAARERSARVELQRLNLRHADFNARHDSDDPAHEEFRQGKERLSHALRTYNKTLDALFEQLGQGIDLNKVAVCP